MATPKTYYAHSAHTPNGDPLPHKHWQTLQTHAQNVGNLAAAFAEYFGAENIARYTGQLHDLGKYSPEFQARLNGKTKPVDHATAGAKIAVERWQVIGKLMAFCIVDAL